MEDVLYCIALLLVASTGFTMCHSDKVMEAFTPGDGSETEQRILAVVDATAASGDQDAQVQQVLFRHWLQGNYEAALPRLQQLAADGHAGAAQLIASAYMHGKGTVVDYDEAASWLEYAAALGSEQAARELAFYRASSP